MRRLTILQTVVLLPECEASWIVSELFFFKLYTLSICFYTVKWPQTHTMIRVLTSLRDRLLLPLLSLLFLAFFFFFTFGVSVSESSSSSSSTSRTSGDISWFRYTEERLCASVITLLNKESWPEHVRQLTDRAVTKARATQRWILNVV